MSITFDCAGRISEGRSLPSFASGAEAKFEVFATFGEGAIVALVDPETSAVLESLYDAEATSGHLRFSDGEETTIVWRRMSGAGGALMAEAIMGDGEVLALAIEHGSEAMMQRPFVLFAAARASLVREPAPRGAVSCSGQCGFCCRKEGSRSQFDGCLGAVIAYVVSGLSGERSPQDPKKETTPWHGRPPKFVKSALAWK